MNINGKSRGYRYFDRVHKKRWPPMMWTGGRKTSININKYCTISFQNHSNEYYLKLLG